MSDDQNLEAQLAAFGQTLESETGEPIRSGSTLAPSGAGSVPRRWWAIGGAAAAGVLAIVGLAALAGRGGDADVAAPAATPVATSPTATQPGPSTTTAATTTTTVATAALEPVPADPLGLEVDGWTLERRTSGPFEFPVDDVPCDGAAVLADFDGVDEVHDILIAPTGGLDVDVQVLDVGSLDAGNRLADGMQAVGDCIGELGGGGVEVGAMSSIRATWFRAGPDFAMATVVGEAGRSIILEIENAPFGDDLIADLIQRSAAYLGTPATIAATDTTTTSLLQSETTVEVTQERAQDAGEDVLDLVADGWEITRFDRLVARPFPEEYLDCPGVAPLVVAAAATVFEVDYETPDRPDVTIEIAVSELDPSEAVGVDVAEATLAFGRCVNVREGEPTEIVIDGVDEIGATWFRIGPSFVIGTVVGIENTVAQFAFDDGEIDDDLVVDVAHRAAQFLAGQPVAGAPAG